ncbi:hypothetical protein NP233_g2997 [Leucocoprinus birnbaumii]|uniref:Uncharacterized protein n=1 Tax=Leucocoprinus birnbaumii TaxID=56174 RepID=A0AAD5VXY1_9AGAR|nr:hypothetical protein NP233_g2997 [Leucocoprinus birnbaumii]
MLICERPAALACRNQLSELSVAGEPSSSFYAHFLSCSVPGHRRDFDLSDAVTLGLVESVFSFLPCSIMSLFSPDFIHALATMTPEEFAHWQQEYKAAQPPSPAVPSQPPIATISQPSSGPDEDELGTPPPPLSQIRAQQLAARDRSPEEVLDLTGESPTPSPVHRPSVLATVKVEPGEFAVPLPKAAAVPMLKDLAEQAGIPLSQAQQFMQLAVCTFSSACQNASCRRYSIFSGDQYFVVVCFHGATA